MATATTITPGQRVLAEGKPATVLAADHPFTQWVRSGQPEERLVCVELDEQDMPAPRSWRVVAPAIPFPGGPHKFRVYALALIRPLES